MAEKPIVSVIECNEYDLVKVKDSLKKGFQKLGGINKFIKENEKVLIKPNVLGPFPPEKNVTAHPVVVQALIQLVKEINAKPFVAESAGAMEDFGTTKALDKAGILELEAKERIPVKPFEETGYKKIRINGRKLNEFFIPNDVIKSNKIISVPKLKTHANTLYTGAIKNSFGFVPLKYRKKAHSFKKTEEFSEALVDIFSVRTPDLIVMDAIESMEGEGPVGGKKANTNLLLLSNDAVALDSTAIDLIGFSEKEVHHVRIAGERGLGEKDLNKINLLIPKNLKKFSFSKPSTVIYEGRIPSPLRRIAIEMITPKPQINRNKCISCLNCVKHCPVKAIKDSGKTPSINRNECIECYCCMEVCSSNAITPKRSLAAETASKILKLIRRREKIINKKQHNCN